MKQGNTILHIIYGFCIALLFILLANKKNETTKTSLTDSDQTLLYTYIDTTGATVTKPFPVAYIVLDSLMQNYAHYTTLEKQYESLYKREENNLKQQLETLQKEASEFQYNVQNGLITSRNAEIKYAELQQREQQLMQLQQTKSMELARKEAELMSQLLDSVKAVIAVYNADKKFEIILNNASNVNVLYATDQLNITQEILTLMNDRYAKSTAKARK